MLLELYVIELAGKRECVSGLCAVSGVPSTTALRWVHMLENRGWVTISMDERDGRRHLLSLTEKSMTGMRRFFEQPELVNFV